MAEQEMIVKYIRNDDGTFNMKFMCLVVRCKNCRWHDDQNGATEWMPCREMKTPNDYYCASGKRKDGDRHDGS